MNKQIHILASVLFLCASSSFTYADNREASQKNIMRNNLQVKKICASYIATLLLGAGIGAATGTLLTYVEQALTNYTQKHPTINSPLTTLLICGLGWMLESEIRNDVITGLQTDLDAYQISYKKSLMFRSAWVAAWLAYLKNSCIF